MLLLPHKPAVALAAYVEFDGVAGPAGLGSRAAASPRRWWRRRRAEAERQTGQDQVLERKKWCLCSC